MCEIRQTSKTWHKLGNRDDLHTKYNEPNKTDYT